MKTECHVCNNIDWFPLPDPSEIRSVTTSGKIVSQPLAKSMCTQCGLVQRVRADFLGLESYYEEDYATYFERPGTEKFHKKRYHQLTNWMKNHLVETFDFRTVLDVGCGQGWAMDAMASKYKGITISGIEPSRHNAAVARKKGYSVFEGKIEDISANDTYDMIYSNNVIQHVNNAREFISNLKRLLSKEGVIIITCPNGFNPNIELFFSDHNYSFLPDNLIQLGSDLGFKNLMWSISEENPSLPPAQLLLLTDNNYYLEKESCQSRTEAVDLELIAKQKAEYLESLRTLETFLLQEISGYSKVYNFGASFWTSVLAAYCPDFWNKVVACIVDTKDTAKEFMGKKIIELKEIEEKHNSIIVLRTSPATHRHIVDKIGNNSKTIRWDTFIKH